MQRRAKTAKAKAVFMRKSHQKPDSLNLAAIKHEEHTAPSIPKPLEKLLRRPLHTNQTSQAIKIRRKKCHSKHKLISLLGKRIAASNSWGGVNIHPIAVLAWLAAEEPFNSEFLLKNAAIFVEGEFPEETDPIVAAQIDGIIQRFNNAAISNAPDSQENPLIERDIPKDFSMLMTPMRAAGLEDHDALMEDCDNKANAMDIPVQAEIVKRKPKKHGFDPVQVLKKHAITFQSAEASRISTLTNAIHPIFREENFHGCPPHIYEVLKPGLQLATLLITHKATSPFWHTALYGIRESTLLPNVCRLRKDVPFTVEVANRYNSRLNKLVDSLHFHFSLWPTAKDQGNYLYGSMHPIKDYALGWLPKLGEPCRYSRICLHTDFYTTAKRLSLLRNPDPAMVMRFNLFFAVNLSHEFAHFLEMSSHKFSLVDTVMDFNAGDTAAKCSKEPFFNDQAFNEIGAAFETKIFGGRVHPISCRIDCAYGLTTFDEPDLLNPLHVRTYYTIPMDFVSRVQQMSTWDENGDGGGEFLKIKRNGAKAVSVPYFDMTVWEDGDEGVVVIDKGDVVPARGVEESILFRREMGRIVRIKT
ncbi:hypothetical protein EJ08DRAFT_50491 [Tothia fuscella]|uniref:Uncharacterized protein n=1 Tax=Tothia fuscella TaxID=1048955 RepID=A0A9P4NFK1_9PEZI|nr:hypothetical protein EJ08DRAFT_50491 [Tothia fuscella]